MASADEALRLLQEVFPQLSLESIAAAYSAAEGSADAAADALHQHVQSSSNKGGQMSNGEEVGARNPKFQGKIGEVPRNGQQEAKNKWITVRSGSISRDRSDGDKKRKKKAHRKKKTVEDVQKKTHQQMEELEEFLTSMLGGETELGRDVVHDIIHQSEGDAQKSLDALLVLLSDEISVENRDGGLWETFPADPPGFQENGGNLQPVRNKLLECEKNHTTKGKESSYQVLSNQVLHQEYSRIQHELTRLSRSFPGIERRTLEEILKTNQYDYSAALTYLIEAGLNPVGVKKEDLARVPGKLLENLLKRPEVSDPPDDGELWKVVKAKPKPDKKPREIIQKINPTSYSELENYDRQHSSAVEHWSTMKHFFAEAAVAYSNGHGSQAAYLSQKGREHKQLAREARARASDRIFRKRNAEYENNITIDLHSQHLDEALKLLSLHLQTLELLTSVHTLTVITGCGNHAPNGQPKLKPAIVAFIKRKRLIWSEVNPGRLQIDLRSAASSKEETKH